MTAQAERLLAHVTHLDEHTVHDLVNRAAGQASRLVPEEGTFSHAKDIAASQVHGAMDRVSKAQPKGSQIRPALRAHRTHLFIGFGVIVVVVALWRAKKMLRSTTLESPTD